jgi:hypothetical protein
MIVADDDEFPRTIVKHIHVQPGIPALLLELIEREFRKRKGMNVKDLLTAR